MAQAKEDYTYEPHRFVFSRAAGQQYCIKCGLVNSNNDFTVWSIQKGCMNELHTSFRNQRLKFTKQFDF